MILEVGPRLYDFLIKCIIAFAFYMCFDMLKVMLVGESLLLPKEDKHDLAE